MTVIFSPTRALNRPIQETPCTFFAAGHRQRARSQPVLDMGDTVGIRKCRPCGSGCHEYPPLYTKPIAHMNRTTRTSAVRWLSDQGRRAMASAATAIGDVDDRPWDSTSASL